jgi:outer membrane protein
VAQYGLLARFNNYEEFFRRFQRHNVQIGASITLPVLPGAAPRAQRAQAQIDISRIQTQINAARNRITLDVRRAYHDLRNAQNSLEVTRQDADLIRSQSSVLAAQAEEGRATLGQVQESRAAEAERALLNLDAEYAVQRARLLVLRLTGTIQEALP